MGTRALSRQSRKTIAGSHDPGDEHKTRYSWDDGAGQHVDERIAWRVTSHYKGGVSLALADQILEGQENVSVRTSQRES